MLLHGQIRDMNFFHRRRGLYLDEVPLSPARSFQDIHPDPDAVMNKSRLEDGRGEHTLHDFSGGLDGLRVVQVVFLNENPLRVAPRGSPPYIMAYVENGLLGGRNFRGE